MAGVFGGMVGGVVRRTSVMATRGAHMWLYVLICAHMCSYVCSFVLICAHSCAHMCSCVPICAHMCSYVLVCVLIVATHGALMGPYLLIYEHIRGDTKCSYVPSVVATRGAINTYE